MHTLRSLKALSAHPALAPSIEAAPPTVVGTDMAMSVAWDIVNVWGTVWDDLSETTRRGIVLARAMRASVKPVKVWEALAIAFSDAVDVDL